MPAFQVCSICHSSVSAPNTWISPLTQFSDFEILHAYDTNIFEWESNSLESQIL